MSEVAAALAFLERLADRGRRLRSTLDADPADASALETIRAWQRDCAATVNELSGGSKAHWLSRAFSAAFLISTPPQGDRALVVEAPASEIVDRLLGVIDQARTSLTQVASGTAPGEPAAPRRFEFVHDSALRPVLEQACADAERALAAGEADGAFMTFCSVLEAVITDALQHQSRIPNPESQRVPTFDERIKSAEDAGLIRGGCARLPLEARRYRERREIDPPVTLRDARLVGQVLRVVMRDLDPGR